MDSNNRGGVPPRLCYTHGNRGNLMNVKSFYAKIKEIDYRHYIALGLTLCFGLLGAFVYRNSYVRLFEACRDFIQALIEYFRFLFNGCKLNSPDISLLQASSITYPLEIAFEDFKEFFISFGESFISIDNFIGYLRTLLKIVFLVCSFGGIFVLIIYLISKISVNVFYSENDKMPFEESKPLKLFLKGRIVYRPVKKWVNGFILFIKNNVNYLKLWLILWLLNLNVVSIIIALVAFCLYFAVSYNVVAVFFQVYKLFMDFTLMIGGLPLIIWVAIGVVLFALFCVRIGKRRLQRIEALCEKFIKSLKSVVIFIVGTMGKGKTKLMTDMALTQRNIFRDKAFEILSNKDLQFPDFPWVKLEQYVLVNMKIGQISKPTDILNLMSLQYDRLKEYGSLCKRIDRYNKKHNAHISYTSIMPFGYDFFNEKVSYNNGLYLESIFQVLVEYAQAFFIYVCDNLNISNYSIRFDDELKSLGNFPLWDYDFTNKTVEKYNYLSRYSYILNFDMLRLTRKIKKNMANGLLTTGVITITEIDKERLNQKELEGIKKSAVEANQKNDGFNYFLKFCRHLSTISFYPFIKVFVDAQRPESWSADGKDLTQIIKVGDEEETRCALPFFGLIDFICVKILDKYRSVYYKYRFYREDRTLTVYLIKTFASKIYDFWLRCHNKYDYTPVKLQLVDGNQEGEPISATYYFAKHKIYSNRYSTDCYAEIFQSIKSKGLTKLPSYQGIHMKKSEFEAQNSYLYQDLDGISKQGGKNGKSKRS